MQGQFKPSRINNFNINPRMNVNHLGGSSPSSPIPTDLNIYIYNNKYLYISLIDT